MSWPELADEIWCHRYYLANLCDEDRFRAWPVVEHIPLLQVSRQSLGTGAPVLAGVNGSTGMGLACGGAHTVAAGKQAASSLRGLLLSVGPVLAETAAAQGLLGCHWVSLWWITYHCCRWVALHHHGVVYCGKWGLVFAGNSGSIRLPDLEGCEWVGLW
jgi:hypothetical protein